MEESDKKLLLNKYLSDPKKYDKYFNYIFNIAYHIYKNINYNDISIFGGAIYYILYKEYKINSKYFKYFQTSDIDLISIYNDLTCLYDKNIKKKIKIQIVNDILNILDDDYVKKYIYKINKLLKCKNKFNITIRFKYYNTTSIKIQIVYTNSELKFHFIDFLIDSKIKFNSSRYTYQKNNFIGENIIISSLYYLSPFGYFWNIISKKYYNKDFKTKEDVYTYICQLILNNITIHEKYVKNFIRARLIYDIIKINKDFLYKNDVQIHVIKELLFKLKSKFFKFILPDLYVNSVLLSKNNKYAHKTLDYYELVLHICLYINKMIVDHQPINDDYCVYLNINKPRPKNSYVKNIKITNTTSLNSIIYENKNKNCTYTKNEKDDNVNCYPKMKYLEKYL